MRNDLRNLDVDGMDMDDMVALAALAKAMQAEYNAAALPVPAWLTESLATLDRAIKAGRRDALEAELKRAKGRIESLKTADEKRADARALVAQLEAELAK